jgi:hypothetical protein
MTRPRTIRIPEAVERCLQQSGADPEAFASGARRAWRVAYAGAGSPTGTVAPLSGQELVAAWQRNLEAEIKKVCERFIKPELFCAVRTVLPQRLSRLGWRSLETSPNDATRMTMALRRVASSAALTFGRRVSPRFTMEDLGTVDASQQERFAKAFLTLLALSEAYFFSMGYNSEFGLGEELLVSEEGFSVPEEGSRNKYVIRTSLDVRKHANFSPFGRIGEFESEALAVTDPFSHKGQERLGDRSALVSGAYAIDLRGEGGYRFLAWPLDPLERFLGQLNPSLVQDALGMPGELFVAFLAGVCSYVQELMSYETIHNAANVSAFAPLPAAMLEGDQLIERTGEILREHGLNPAPEELHRARDQFLYLSTSVGKAGAEELPLRTSLSDTRYSYLLHRFGEVYLVDLFHADHWLHRPFDLLASKMSGREGGAKGTRVEEAVWQYTSESDAIQPVEELKNLKVRVEGRDFNDLDCPLRVGDTIVLVEAKGKLLRYPAEAVDRESVVKRWEENTKYLKKIDATAQVLAERKNQPGYRDGMKGVRRILPVVCRPYPEWVPELDPRYWLRLPTVHDPGVPRILTPPELKRYLEGVDEDVLRGLPRECAIEVR